MSRPPAAGMVSLVGAGPGDPGLITVAGLWRLREADVVVYDRLVGQALLQEAGSGAELIYVGKIPGTQPASHPSHDQEGINRVLVEKAREGKRVVRLKGGDPFVLGRGGEEAEALRAAGIPFEVIPGVTSAVAVPAYAGIPVTHRGVASTFAVITGHEGAEKEESAIDWERLATAVDTLVFLMGTKALPDIVRQLTRHGRSPDTPAAVIRWGTTPEQRTVTGTLGDIVRRAEEAGLTPPAITVVGEVVRLRETLRWFEDRPLFGKRVLITRTREQASVLAERLRDEGAVPIELPAIEIEPVADDAALDAAARGLRERNYAWAGFTSANGVELFFQALASRGLDARAFGGARVFAIGPATAAALRERGIIADAVPAEYVAEGLLEALATQVRSGDRVLLPRAEAARPELAEGLRGAGATVDEVPLYRAVPPQEPPPEPLAALREGRIDIVTFTSSSTVRNLVQMLGDAAAVILSGETGRARRSAASRRNLEGTGLGTTPERTQNRPLIACIGPVTAQTARELGLPVDVEAPEHTVEGLVRALKADLAAESGAEQ